MAASWQVIDDGCRSMPCPDWRSLTQNSSPSAVMTESDTEFIIFGGDGRWFEASRVEKGARARGIGIERRDDDRLLPLFRPAGVPSGRRYSGRVARGPEDPLQSGTHATTRPDIPCASEC
ncbi:MAG: hypothetical protein QM766_11785 [Burkholderiaceae bacterium]